MTHAILSLLALSLLLLGNVQQASAQQVRGPRHVKAKVSQKQEQVHKVDATPKKKAFTGTGRVTLKAAFNAVKKNFQLYKGDHLEAWGNRLKVGRSDFDTKHTVHKNLESLVQQTGMDHYYADFQGRKVLHLVVDLGEGRSTKDTLRSVMRRVAAHTVELNFKGASDRNPYGHVAVRVGNGALYDLTGTRGMASLPKFMERILTFVQGDKSLTFARKRNLRRFMEGREDTGQGTGSVYYGMLFKASAAEIKETQGLYNERLEQATSFNVSGGNAKQGEYSCAQFLTEEIPFFNSRGIGRMIGARSTATAAQKSLQLEAVIVYKSASTPRVNIETYP